MDTIYLLTYFSRHTWGDDGDDDDDDDDYYYYCKD